MTAFDRVTWQHLRLVWHWTGWGCGAPFQLLMCVLVCVCVLVYVCLCVYVLVCVVLVFCTLFAYVT